MLREVPFTTRSIYPKVSSLMKRTTFQYRFVFPSYPHLIIFEKLISINECNFMFINIEVVRTIT
jgi:hypothetical protein